MPALANAVKCAADFPSSPLAQEPRDSGGMLSPYRMTIGALGVGPEDVPAPRLPDELSLLAQTVGAWLAERACPINGEAICSLAVIAGACNEAPGDVLLAMDELLARGTITFFRFNEQSERGLVHCGFDVDSDLYYGDDRNLPPDWDASEELAWQDEQGWTYPESQRERVLEKTCYWCFYCIVEPAAHLDHMHPKSRGGSDDDANLIGACPSCNIQKKDRTVEEYRAYLAYRRRLPSISHVRFYGEAVQ